MEQRYRDAKQPMYLGILAFFVVGQTGTGVCVGGTLGAEIGNVNKGGFYTTGLQIVL